MKLNVEIARDLLEIKAVQIRPNNYFTWTSGIKSPIYCDNRLTMSYPDVRNKLIKAFIAEIKAMDIQPDVIAGCATAGIPHAAWVADKLNLPMVYVRSKPKGHGKGNQIEGKVEKGQNVLVIEDLISTGGSSIEAAKVLMDEGLHVTGVLAIFTYGLAESTRRFAQETIPFKTITTFELLIDALVADEEITLQDKEELLQWRDQI
ncbi:orotate phosphoribosyltransferase [Virgibacillus sp. W0430]|uniref:orotate phosphoribosyltransferase n=1 Tax=Virgibacillus sp. W0430 TaxID=3391580 RepID=UPI003F460001